MNLKAGFLLSRDVAKLMAEKGGGNIVFVASYTGLKPATGLGVYSVSKTAMLGLTRTLASEWVNLGIRVNAGNVSMKLTIPYRPLPSCWVMAAQCVRA